MISNSKDLKPCIKAPKSLCHFELIKTKVEMLMPVSIVNSSVFTMLF
jgi:hypothetical protein